MTENKLSTKRETWVADSVAQDYEGFAHVEEITKPWWKIKFSFHNWIQPRQRMQKRDRKKESEIKRENDEFVST